MHLHALSANRHRSRFRQGVPPDGREPAVFPVLHLGDGGVGVDRFQADRRRADSVEWLALCVRDGGVAGVVFEHRQVHGAGEMHVDLSM